MGVQLTRILGEERVEGIAYSHPPKQTEEELIVRGIAIRVGSVPN